MKVFVVTLRDRNKLEEFYEDMETPGGSLYIPNRMVEVSDRRPISRSTHYLLTDEEAESLRKDERVLSVEDPRLEPPPQVMDTPRVMDQPDTPEPANITDSDVKNQVQYNPNFGNTLYFWKDPSWLLNGLNWGLVEHTKTNPTSTVGSFWGTTDAKSLSGASTTANYRSADTISLDIPGTGKNVDVIIWDGGTIIPEHPEFAKNADGSGGTRCVQVDWNSYTGESAYTYTDKYDDHAMNVAGIAVGNRYGWARDANIYSMDFNISNGIDKIRAWHAAKSINSATGRKNPTVVNMSWGSFYSFGNGGDFGWPTSMRYRGVVTNNDSDFKSTKYLLENHNMFPGNYNPNYASGKHTLNYYSDAFAADIADATAEGIIFVAAAGNYVAYCDTVNGTDWDNYAVGSGYLIYTHRCNKTSAPGVICVGAQDVTTLPRKTDFSNTGPRIDVWAAGRSIVSASTNNAYSDLRNSSYKITSMSGTSQASPQVCGMLACMLEYWPGLTADEARHFLTTGARDSDMRDSTFTYTDFTAARFALRGASMAVAYTKSPRPSAGKTWPNTTYKPRMTTGVVYPRVRRI